MRGKIGIVIGLAAGYVLGTRAGRERYDQMHDSAMKIWNSAPVQKQVAKATEFGKSAALAVPSVVWDSAVKVTKAATKQGDTPGQKIDSAIKATKDSADDIERSAKMTADEVKQAAQKVADDMTDAADS